ncbi:MAG TPA: ABC transporter substrate-binding protein [Candidatus Limnocylindrales bacterium]|nr:ABC transporter substrate-binding protein [Candidatus Limnocylindrales bacterium]
MRRRHLLKAAVAVMAAPAAACASNDDTIEVFVLWSGGELDAFRHTVDDFTRESGRRVRIVTVGEQVRELLRARFNANNPPDIAIVPMPGLVREYARDGKVRWLDRSLTTAMHDSLNETVTVEGRQYGLWVKAAHKSLFWYRYKALRAAGENAPPRTWPHLVEMLAAQAKVGRPMLSIGAADGWVLTDWFENVLAGMDGGATYRRLARDEPEAWGSDVVSGALERLAEVWAIPGVFPYGPQRALLTQYEESVFEVFAECRSAMVFEGDFVGAILTRLDSVGRLCENADLFPFPAITGEPPLVVGGDVAARLSDSAGSDELMEWLSRPESMSGWAAQAGFLSPNRNVPISTYLGRDRILAQQFYEATTPLFDLSDQLGGRLSAGQGRGLPRILTEFFRDVTEPGAHPATAIGTAQSRMLDAARGVAE